MPVINKNHLNCYYLHDLCVHPDFRRQGIGRQLLSLAVRRARQLNYREIYLISVQDSVTFWNKQGFKRVKQTTYGEGQVAYKMRCLFPDEDAAVSPP